MDSILEQLTPIFIDVLDNPKIVLTEKTTAADIEEWDSLNNIHLVVAVENHFNISFTASEMQEWKSVGDLVENINSKLQA